MRRRSSHLPFTTLIVFFAAVVVSILSERGDVWAASSVSQGVSKDFLRRLNQRLSAPAVPSGAAEDRRGPSNAQQEQAPQQVARTDGPAIPERPSGNVRFGPAPKFLHRETGLVVDETPEGVALGWWDLPSGSVVFSYGAGGQIVGAFIVAHGEKTFLKSENIPAALSVMNAQGAPVPGSLAPAVAGGNTANGRDPLERQYASETPPGVPLGWWNLPNCTHVFARNASGQPTRAYMVVHGEKKYLKSVSLQVAINNPSGQCSTRNPHSGYTPYYFVPPSASNGVHGYSDAHLYRGYNPYVRTPEGASGAAAVGPQAAAAASAPIRAPEPEPWLGEDYKF